MGVPADEQAAVHTSVVGSPGIGCRALLAASALAFAAGNAQAQDDLPAELFAWSDVIVVNTTVYTMDNKAMLDPDPGTVAEAMAIRDGRVQAVGDEDYIRRMAGPDTRVWDLQGKTVLPGFIDTHAHPEASMNRGTLSEEWRERARAPEYTTPPTGLHFAVQARDNPQENVEQMRRILEEYPPREGEWIIANIVPDPAGRFADIASTTFGVLHDSLITKEDLNRVAPDNPMFFASGTGPRVTTTPGEVVRLEQGPDGAPVREVLVEGADWNDYLTDASPEADAVVAENSPWVEAHLNRPVPPSSPDGHAWFEPEVEAHHFWDGSLHTHRSILLNSRAKAYVMERWPQFEQVANEWIQMEGIAGRSGTLGLVAGALRSAGTVQEIIWPTEIPQDIYNEWAKTGLIQQARGGTTTTSSSLEEGQSVTAYYDILRREGRLPIRFGYGYEMFRAPQLSSIAETVFREIGAHWTTPESNPWFWVKGVTDGGAGDMVGTTCFGDYLPGPEEEKALEMCQEQGEPRIGRILVPAVQHGWRIFSTHAFGPEQLRIWADIISYAAQNGKLGLSEEAMLERVREGRWGFAHGQNTGAVPEVMEALNHVNAYVPISYNQRTEEAVVEAMRYDDPELGISYIKPARSMLEQNVNVVGELENQGGDPYAPFVELYFFVTREDPRTERIINPDEALDRATALRMYTTRAAEWVYGENVMGSLEPGRFADFVVIDEDYFEQPALTILDNRVLATVVDGELVYVQFPDHWSVSGETPLYADYFVPID